MTPEARAVIQMVRDEILTPERWTRGGPGVKMSYDHRIDDKPFCLAFAMDFTRADIGVREEAAAVLLKDEPKSRDAAGVLNREYYPANIIDWNDTPGRTFEDVRALLDKALKEPNGEATDHS